MSLSLQPGEHLADGVRRIFQSELAAALAELQPEERKIDARVHSMRKRMKRLRALLRMVRASIGEQTYRSCNAAFRDAARQLAGAREAAVRVKGLAALCDDGQVALPPGFEQALRERLSHSRRSQVSAALADRVVLAHALLEAASERVSTLHLPHRGFGLVRRDFERSYARARRGRAHSLRSLSTEAFHEWRKWVKYHLHQVELLAVTWTDELELRTSALKELADLLGDEHDLADLRAALLSEPLGELPPGPTAELLGLLDRRRQTLREEALRLGARLFAEKPRAFSGRVERYYDSWREEQSEHPTGGDE